MSLWLIGAGNMSKDYAHVLNSLKQDFKVIGRNKLSAEKFFEDTGIRVYEGGISKALSQNKPPLIAIVAVNIEMLAEVTMLLIDAGVKRILVEKPGGLCKKDIQMIADRAKDREAVILIAYNRHFYASVNMARKLINEDGGARSCFFEFTEWSHVISSTVKSARLKKLWFLSNSSHVVDLAFHFCGLPKRWNAWKNGSLSWHPSASRFSGSGITDRDILFSYFADWEGPGRWALEVLSSKRRFIFKPMEQLHILKIGSFEPEKVILDDSLDKKFKPGLYLQTKAFLENDDILFTSIDKQLIHSDIYNEMAGYN